MRAMFGDVVFDGDRRRVERRAEPVQLTAKAFQLLEILVERAPNVVSRGELIELLWPDVVVVEANLTNLVAEIRRQLGEAERSCIRTVRRFGYQLEEEVTRLDPPVRSASEFQLRIGDQRIRLTRGVNLLGRDADSIVPSMSPGVSRRHAQIVVTADKALLQDLGSRNGTFVRGKRIDSPVELRTGDSIVLGSDLVGIFETIATPGPTQTLPPAKEYRSR